MERRLDGFWIGVIVIILNRFRGKSKNFGNFLESRFPPRRKLEAEDKEMKMRPVYR